MKKLVAFCGSPRKNGFTRELMNKVIDGAKSEGMEISFYDLNEKGIRGCQHCRYCRNHEGCAIKDDPLSPMYGEIVEADAILFGSPIYFFNLAGQSKIWLDRMFPMFDTPGLKPRYPGKKSVTVFAQEANNSSLYQVVVDETKDLFNRLGWEVVDSLISAGGSELSQEFLDRAYIAGTRLAQK